MLLFALIFKANKQGNRLMNNLNYTYIWQQPDWTNWQFDLHTLSPLLTEAHYQQGLLLGRMLDLGMLEREQTNLQFLTESIVKSSEIEGEILNVQSVRSSLAKRLGIESGALPPTDRHVEGVVEMLLNAVTFYQEPLNKTRLFGWHAALFPTGYSGISKICVGQFRDDSEGAMQVVSGSYGREKVHFQAPPAECLETEITRFLNWINQEQSLDPFLKAAIAHLWFLTLHPFEDGNGRIARAIADMQLAKADSSRQRFYSLSAQIQQHRSSYYEMLEDTQKGLCNLTAWLSWFLQMIIEAIKSSHKTLDKVLVKNRYWQAWKNVELNERQRKVLNRLLDNFEGHLTNQKWASLTKVSRDTALRDINDLVEKGILQRTEKGGRSVAYVISPL